MVFTAANARALSDLSGQVLNLRSAYENIADQKLNIVLASGAAAYNAAVGAATPTPVLLGNQRVGVSLSAALNVSNTAAPGTFSEDLRAVFGTNRGTATNNGGTIAQLVACGNNVSLMSVGLNTTSAGAETGSVTLNYDTTGTVNGVSNGLALQGANAPQVINVSGNVYQLAAGALQTAPLNFGTLRVGQTVSQNLVVRNTASGAMSVTVTGATASALNSSIAVNYFSAGAVAGLSNGLGSFAAGSEAYAVNCRIQAGANVINQANPQINNSSINLGAVRVGAAAPTAFASITNSATAAPQAALNASIAPSSGPITASGSFNLLNPRATNNSSLQAALNTATAGISSQNGSGCFCSQNVDLADIGAGGAHSVLVQAQIDALAYAQINLRGGQGSLSMVGDTFTLDFCTLTEGSSVSNILDVSNQVASPADAINGAFDLAAATGLSLANWNAFTGLLAGADTDDMTLAFTATGTGLFERLIAFNGTSTNASDPAGVAALRNLVIRVDVAASAPGPGPGPGAVPEPGSMALVLAAAAAALLTRRCSAARA